MEPGEDHRRVAPSTPFGGRLDVHEPVEQVEPRVALPDPLPQVRGAVPVRVRRVARRRRSWPRLNGRNRVALPASRVVIATGSVSTAKCTTARAQQRVRRVAVGAVLLDRVLDGLPVSGSSARPSRPGCR